MSTDLELASRESQARLYLHRVRPVIPAVTLVAFLAAWLAFDRDYLLVISGLLMVSTLAGLMYAAALPVLSTRTVIRISLFVDIAIVTALVAQVPDPTGATLAFMWSVAIASIFDRGKVVALVSATSALAFLGVEIWSNDGDLALGVTNAIVLAVIGVLISLLSARERAVMDHSKDMAVELINAQRLSRTGSWVWHVDTGIIEWSPGMYELFAAEPSDEVTLDSFFDELVHELDRERVRDALRRAVELGTPYDLDMRVAGADAGRRILHVRGVVAPERRERVMIGTAQDVTDDRELTRVQQEFVATASHELRTPTTVVAGFARTMVDHWSTLDDARKLEFTHLILNSANQLASVVEDVLLSSRIESGLVPVAMQNVDLRGILEPCVLAFQERALNVTLRFADDASEVMVCTDPVRFCQIVMNLLTNAERYSGSNFDVDIAVTCVADMATIHVRDRGIGIEPADRERVFERFVRLEDAHTRAEAGTGLGLYISRQLARSMRGSLRVGPTEGAGTTLVLELPLAD